MGVGEARRHQGTHKDKDVDMGGPLRQEWPAMEAKEKPPEIEIAPTEVKGWAVSMRSLNNA